jgi:LDH2 family malate/lactate/ureidoglycolate dehydrogenase
MSTVVLAAAWLRDYCERLLLAAGTPLEASNLVAESLVAASLRGVDSHGVQLLTFYLDQILDGRVDVHATGGVVVESGAMLLYDGENGLGQVIASAACRHATRLAAAHGLGLVVTRESNHFGAAAWWGLTMARAGCIGIVMCNASPMVAPWQGREPRCGTNPICVALPGPDEGAWLLDMATTTVAMGKVYKAWMRGDTEIPAGWAMDREGVPTTDPAVALNGLLMPLGGYKGSGLAMMVEILCGVFSGGAMGPQLGGLRFKDRPFRASQLFLAIDPGRFGPPETFHARVRELVAMAKSSPPARGHEEVLVAGDPEWRAEAHRRAHGVPVEQSVWDSLAKFAERLGVTVPEWPLPPLSDEHD